MNTGNGIATSNSYSSPLSSATCYVTMNTGNGIATKGSSTMHLPSFLCYVIMNTGNGIRENKKNRSFRLLKTQAGKERFFIGE